METSVSYVASMCCTLMNLKKQTSDEDWAEVARYLKLLDKNVPSDTCAKLKAKCAEMMVVEEVDDDEDDAEELCNCQFTLAYGEVSISFGMQVDAFLTSY